MKELFRLFLLPALFLAVACHEPEPEPEPEKKPSAADSLTVGLGSALAVTPADILGDAFGGVSVDAEGTYLLEFPGGEASLVVPALKDYDAGAQFRRYCNYPISHDYQIVGRVPAVSGGRGTISLPWLDATAVDLGTLRKSQLITAQNLPEGMLSLEDIVLTEESRVEVQLSIPNVWFTAGTIRANFLVDMSRFFTSPDAANGMLTIDTHLNAANGWSATKTFRLSGVPFDPSGYDPETRKLSFPAGVSITGAMSFSDMETTVQKMNAAPDATMLRVVVTLKGVAVASFTGRQEYASKDVTLPLDLDPLKALPLPLDLTSMRFSVSGTNSSRVPLQVVPELVARKNMRNLGSAPLPGVYLPENSGTVTVTADVKGTGHEDGDAARLLAQKPDALEVRARVATCPDRSLTIGVGQSYEAACSVRAECPLIISAGYCASFERTVPITGGGKVTSGSRIKGKVSNTLPLDANVVFDLVDDAGHPASRPFNVAVRAGKDAAMEFSLEDVTPGACSVRMRSVLTGVDGGGALKAADSLSADLELVVGV